MRESENEKKRKRKRERKREKEKEREKERKREGQSFDKPPLNKHSTMFAHYNTCSTMAWAEAQWIAVQTPKNH